MILDELLLKPHPFLAGLTDAQLRRLAATGARVHFAAGSRIFHEGATASHFYLIERGRVLLETHSAGHPVPVQTLGDGEVLGWSWLFPPFCWHFGARAEDDTDAIAFDAARLRAECECDPSLGYEIMKRIAEMLTRRLQAARLKLVQAHRPQRHPELPIEN